MTLLRSRASTALRRHGDIFGGGALRGPGGKFRLDDEPGFKELMVGEVVQQHEEIDRFVEDGLRALREIGAVANPLRKNAHHLQYFERLAHRCAIGSEFLRHLALRGKFGAG